MTGGAGFARNAINSIKENRSLLKGNKGTTYKSFDKELYHFSSKKTFLKFKKASPEFRQKLKNQLTKERLVDVWKQVIILLLVTFLVFGCILCLSF